jgi:hypothetical protein
MWKCERGEEVGGCGDGVGLRCGLFFGWVFVGLRGGVEVCGDFFFDR